MCISLVFGNLMYYFITEADICQRGGYTCSKNATCVREGPSHTCGCKAEFYDQNPTVPGTDCKSKNTLLLEMCATLYIK